MFYGDDVSITTHSPFRIPQFIGCFTLYGQFLRILFIYILALRIFQVFLQTDPALMNLCRSFFSNIAIMPYLFGHIGDVRLIAIFGKLIPFWGVISWQTVGGYAILRASNRDL